MKDVCSGIRNLLIVENKQPVYSFKMSEICVQECLGLIILTYADSPR